jgi:hypothetical protein
VILRDLLRAMPHWESASLMNFASIGSDSWAELRNARLKEVQTLSHIVARQIMRPRSQQITAVFVGVDIRVRGRLPWPLLSAGAASVIFFDQ